MEEKVGPEADADRVNSLLKNLADYAGDKPTKLTLTSLLHVKKDTRTITIQQLEMIIRSILKDAAPLPLPAQQDLVIDTIYDVAQQIAEDKTETAALEEKVVLSIAVRLKAEDYMIAKINDSAFWEGIKINQTVALVRRYKSDFPQSANSEVLDQVNLMTPENIHLNSFMYEPILDLSAQHLKKLYLNVAALN
jgi:hypothetical protein